MSKEVLWLGGLGAAVLLDGARTSHRCAVIGHQIHPRTLAAPLHTHSREDEYSFVLEGEIHALIGKREVEARAGELIVKPRGIAHTFWNASDEPARILELISPAGFERFFGEAAALIEAGKWSDPDASALAARYGLVLDLASVPRLREKYGVR